MNIDARGIETEPPSPPMEVHRPVPDLVKHIKSGRGAYWKAMFPSVAAREWNDWKWQFANRIRTQAELGALLRLSADETAALNWELGALPFAVTPYYATLLDPEDSSHPLRRTVIPSTMEHMGSMGESPDPLGEEGHSPVPGVVHRYHDRVLFLATTECSTYCRYCTRSRIVGSRNSEGMRKRWEMGFEYIAMNPQIRDVVVSGGDPMTLSDDALDYILSRLDAIPHVEIKRIGTKVPAVLPQRVTPALVRMLKKHHPLFISLHATHPAELTPQMRQACERLADGGMPLGSQTVLLKGVNDNLVTLRRLFTGLLSCRVRPYYLYQCDPITGSSHFRTAVDAGLDLMSGLRGHISGYGVPTYVIDAPGGGGKIPVFHRTVIGQGDNGLMLRNHEGRVFNYPDTVHGECHEEVFAAHPRG